MGGVGGHHPIVLQQPDWIMKLFFGFSIYPCYLLCKCFHCSAIYWSNILCCILQYAVDLAHESWMDMPASTRGSMRLDGCQIFVKRVRVQGQTGSYEICTLHAQLSLDTSDWNKAVQSDQNRQNRKWRRKQPYPGSRLAHAHAHAHALKDTHWLLNP